MAEIVQRIVIETALLPPIVLDRPMADTGAPPNPLLSLLKPKISITTPLRPDPYVARPYGDPGATKWPVVAIGGAVVAALALGLMVRGLVK